MATTKLMLIFKQNAIYKELLSALLSLDLVWRVILHVCIPFVLFSSRQYILSSGMECLCIFIAACTIHLVQQHTM